MPLFQDPFLLPIPAFWRTTIKALITDAPFSRPFFAAKYSLLKDYDQGFIHSCPFSRLFCVGSRLWMDEKNAHISRDSQIPLKCCWDWFSCAIISGAITMIVWECLNTFQPWLSLSGECVYEGHRDAWGDVADLKKMLTRSKLLPRTELRKTSAC